MVVFEVNPCALGHAQQCQQLTRILPQLKSIGVEVIYLMPIFKKGSLHAVGSPYCIADFESMQSAWGSFEDWNVFRETCETWGLRIWMDWVMNHTAWDHPWVKEHPEFYHQNENGKLHHPFGTDWTDVVQLNGAHAEVLLYFQRLAANWINRGVTGFRVDAACRMPSTYLSQWINHVKELSSDTTVLVDAWEVMMQQPLCDGLMTSDSALWNKERVWPVLYGHDAAAFGCGCVVVKPRREHGDVLDRDADQDFAVVHPDQHDFLACTYRESFHGLQALGLFSQQALAILELAQCP